jgi:hypothetical protein
MKPEIILSSSKCSSCGVRLLSLYYRDNGDGERSWERTRYMYCKNCKKIKKHEEQG